MGGKCRVAALRFEMRSLPEREDRPPDNGFDPEDETRCPCCGSQMEQRGERKGPALGLMAGIVLAIVGFGTGSGALSVGAPGTFGNSVVGLLLVVGGVVSFLWGVSGILSHAPLFWECPYCGYRREER